MDIVKESETEKRILKAAKKIFQKRGFYGARMQDISEEAGINKAMLHYYFRGKDKLFDAVMNDAFDTLFLTVGKLLDNDMPVKEKIEKFTGLYIDMLMENQFLPAFVLHEINHNPERLAEMFRDKLSNKPLLLISQLVKEMEKGNMIDIDPRHIIINLLGMCVFPFVAKPLLIANFGFSEEGFHDMLMERKKLIPLFLLNSVKKQ
jgi:TetR/AcrR family transcriptional regulator